MTAKSILNSEDPLNSVTKMNLGAYLAVDLENCGAIYFCPKETKDACG